LGTDVIAVIIITIIIVRSLGWEGRIVMNILVLILIFIGITINITKFNHSNTTRIIKMSILVEM
jgi:hypothetical protein